MVSADLTSCHNLTTTTEANVAFPPSPTYAFLSAEDAACDVSALLDLPASALFESERALLSETSLSAPAMDGAAFSIALIEEVINNDAEQKMPLGPATEQKTPPTVPPPPRRAIALCGTFGCTLPDGHRGLHEIPEASSARRCASSSAEARRPSRHRAGKAPPRLADEWQAGTPDRCWHSSRKENAPRKTVAASSPATLSTSPSRSSSPSLDSSTSSSDTHHGSNNGYDEQAAFGLLCGHFEVQPPTATAIKRSVTAAAPKRASAKRRLPALRTVPSESSLSEMTIRQDSPPPSSGSMAIACELFDALQATVPGSEQKNAAVVVATATPCVAVPFPHSPLQAPSEDSTTDGASSTGTTRPASPSKPGSRASPLPLATPLPLAAAAPVATIAIAPVHQSAAAPAPAVPAASSPATHATSTAASTARRGYNVERKEWTQAEDQIIRDAVSSFGFRWRRIAARLPGRSDDAVRNRWNRLTEALNEVSARTNEDSSSQQPPAAATDAMLFGEDDDSSNSALGEPSSLMFALPLDVELPSDAMGSGGGGERKRTVGGGSGGQKPRKRSRVQRLPGSQPTRLVWSHAEDDIILRFVREYGHKWYVLKRQLPNRTEHAIRNRFHRLQTYALEDDCAAAMLESETLEGDTAASMLMDEALLNGINEAAMV
jgi:hypothetical protein